MGVPSVCKAKREGRQGGQAKLAIDARMRTVSQRLCNKVIDIYAKTKQEYATLYCKDYGTTNIQYILITGNTCLPAA